MHFTLQNSVTTLDLKPDATPMKWLFDLAGLKPRITQQKRYGRPGAKLMGDKQEDSRTATLKKTIASASDSLYIDEMNAIYAMFDPAAAPLYLNDTDNARRILIELSGADSKSKPGTEMRVEDADFNLIVPEVFWEGISFISVDSGSAGSANNEMLIVNNPSQKLVCYPIITITSENANSNINLLNVTTGGILTIGTNAFVPGTSIEIDCQNGLIWLSDGVTRVDIISALADNTGMLFLIPGDNVIKYESAFGPISIDISFRQKWAF